MRNKKAFLMLLLIIPVLAILAFNSAGLFKASIEKEELHEGNTTEGKIHIFSGQTEIPNTFGTKDNPYLAYIGEWIELYQVFEEDEYAEAKATLSTTVYDNDFVQNGQNKQIVSRLGTDVWNDQLHKLNFAFEAKEEGLCRIVLHHNNDWNDSIETVYVRVLAPNTIYYKDRFRKDYVKNPGNVVTTINDNVELVALLNGNLNMDGDKPSEANFVGSGFWSWAPVTIKNEWEHVMPSKWVLKYNYVPKEGGYVSFNLGKNGDGTAGGSINVIAVQNKITLDNIKVGNKEFDHVDKHTATKMFNGYNYGDNTDHNRLSVLVGDKLYLSAEDTEGYTFESTNTDILRVVEDSKSEDGKTSIVLQGKTPGDVQVDLKNADGEVTETIYLTVKYPINVVTSVGEHYKDYTHEFLDIILTDMYHQLPFFFVTDNEGNPLYVKNGDGFYLAYMLFKGDKVTLTSYVPKSDSTKFVVDSGAKILSQKESSNLIGDLKDFKKVEAEIEILADSGLTEVTFGSEKFDINVMDQSANTNHLDFETTDGGTVKMTTIVLYPDGTKERREVLYKAYVTDIHGSKAYDEEGNVLAEISDNEYWQTSPEVFTQYESTSAYVTNDEGHLVDNNSNVIDDLVRNRLAAPIVKSRDIPLADIEKVEFKADLKLTAVSKTIIFYDENDEETSRKTEKIAPEEKTLEGISIDMNRHDIIDALNKCPDHSGLDFTVKLMIEETDTTLLKNPNTGIGLSILIITVLVLSIGSIVIIKKKKKGII